MIEQETKWIVVSSGVLPAKVATKNRFFYPSAGFKLVPIFYKYEVFHTRNCYRKSYCSYLQHATSC